VRIAIYHNLPSGGAKRALFNYTRGLAGAGHEVDVYAPASADEEFLDLRPLVAAYHRIPLRIAVGFYWWGLLEHGREAAAAIDAGRYDVAFVHHCQFTQTPYLLRFLDTPSVYYCQEPRRVSFEYSIRHLVAEPQRALGLRRPRRELLETVLRTRDIAAARAATLILANSFYSVESIKRAYGRYARVSYLGTDLGAFRPSGGARTRAVVSVGALHPAKGHDLVIDAVGAVAADHRPEVHVVADRQVPGQARALAARARAAGVSLRVHERITDAELVERYSTAMVTVCAAELEPFGFTPLESMACGTPVVAVREGGYKETVIDQVNGRLVERDAGQLAAAITELITDETRWAQLSAGALDSVDRWSLDPATATLERFLAETRRGA
jgi:glycosyltransferase involved in cell wall biosynthesis